MQSQPENRKQQRNRLIASLTFWGGALFQLLSFGDALFDGIPAARASLHLVFGLFLALAGAITWRYMPGTTRRSEKRGQPWGALVVLAAAGVLLIVLVRILGAE